MYLGDKVESGGREGKGFIVPEEDVKGVGFGVGRTEEGFDNTPSGWFVEDGRANSNKVDDGVDGWLGGVEVEKLKGGGGLGEGGEEDNEKEEREGGEGRRHVVCFLIQPKRKNPQVIPHNSLFGSSPFTVISRCKRMLCIRRN